MMTPTRLLLSIDRTPHAEDIAQIRAVVLAHNETAIGRAHR